MRGFDPFIALLLATLGLGAIFPVQGAAFVAVDHLSSVMIALLFFLHGVRLPRAAVIEGLRHWRLHLTILSITFIFMPLLALAFSIAAPHLLTAALWGGIFYLSALPSTVQSSIAFTSIAGGNVAGAIVSAAASNLIGVVVTPVIIALLAHVSSASLSLSGIGGIMLLLLLPFMAGQIMRRWLADWAVRTRRITSYTDRATVLLAVYVAFSEATNENIWRQLPPAQIGLLFAICTALLVTVLLSSNLIARLLGFDRADRIAIVFCGSKKSLATGVPMAKLLFAGSMVGPIVVPLMIFHQIQLLTCAWLARKWVR